MISQFSKFLTKEEGWEKAIRSPDPDSEPYSVDMLMIETVNVLWKCMKKFGVLSEKETVKLYEQMIKPIEDGIIIIEPGIENTRPKY